MGRDVAPSGRPMPTRRIDVFNGDADGICALHQLRLAAPADSELVTGVKRDIALLERVAARLGPLGVAPGHGEHHAGAVLDGGAGDGMDVDHGGDAIDQHGIGAGGQRNQTQPEENQTHARDAATSRPKCERAS